LSGYGWIIEGLIPGRGKRYISSPNVQNGSWHHPLPGQCVLRALTAGVQRPVREVHSSPPTSASVPPICLHSVTGTILRFIPVGCTIHRSINQLRKQTLSTVYCQTDFDRRNSAFHNRIISVGINEVTLLTYCFPVSNSRSDNRRLPSCRSTNKSVIGGRELCE
jgi:hypothetical protein